MKKILFVEDDALIARVYSQKLAGEGFEVAVAEDGLAAMKRLPEFKPDIVVLDLLMPKFTGVDVLKFMRKHPDLKDTRVIVFSNSFLSDLVGQVAAVGVEEALVKAAVTPKRLIEVINRVLAGPPATLSDEALAARFSGATGLTAPPESKSPESESRPELSARIQREFTERVPIITRSVRRICEDFLNAANSPVESRKLEDLDRKIGFLTQMTGMAGRTRAAQLCSALEALLFELQEKPASITDSCRRTIAATVAFLAEWLEPGHGEIDEAPLLPVLVIDDDAVSNRAVVLALGRANLPSRSSVDPFEALQRLGQNAYSLVLLDINMPGLDGITLCEKMRTLPLHKRTPVVFFTAEQDFKVRMRSILSGGNDLITKPVLPTELCVKVLTHVLREQPAKSTAA